MRSAKLPIRVLTHNIRYATSSPFKGERPWSERKQLLLNEFEYETRHCGETFVCLQEVLHNQLGDILAGLNRDTEPEAPEWEYIGVGRDDGHEAGEYSPIIYRPSVWELLHWETVWLSKTPETPSKSWDAASIRIVTIGVFTHRATRNTVLAMNTHLDDQGSQSRLEAARIILGKISEYSQNKFAKLISGIFLTGDFNSEENQEAYQELTKSLLDAFKEVESSRRYGNHITWTGFGYEDEPASRIDYVLVVPGTLTVIGYAVLGNRFDDGVLSSDHRAVIVDLTL
ncbi:Endonuclease/exonuclease/phosphatase [Penicillium cf. griseofulvum]|uniref:Endonuclease/exonuclease/phosphatase n=1 Tax=Penicillium cf. griseofulvum TaxID=2972120 RepID=A0A9W9MFP9_9EURO|nr:Endonuclease/exonuclease/phosphatase [Penicillium cf. griseofulvum]KAJ5423391.1 Endonuclease/exonuclease/phosphatase [Penicillium cf. griseofulvum]